MSEALGNLKFLAGVMKGKGGRMNRSGREGGEVVLGQERKGGRQTC